jgi:hypothetical protein
MALHCSILPGGAGVVVAGVVVVEVEVVVVEVEVVVVEVVVVDVVVVVVGTGTTMSQVQSFGVTVNKYVPET